MPDPSLTLARRLYARKHGLRVADVSLNVTCIERATPRRAWDIVAYPTRGGMTPDACATNHPTERAAVRALCRALGWRP